MGRPCRCCQCNCTDRPETLSMTVNGSNYVMTRVEQITPNYVSWLAAVTLPGVSAPLFVEVRCSTNVIALNTGIDVPWYGAGGGTSGPSINDCLNPWLFSFWIALRNSDDLTFALAVSGTITE